MSERTFAEPKKSTLPPVAGRHPESPGHQHQPPAATENDYLTTVGHEFSRVAVAGPQRATPGFSQSCPMSLDTPRACPFGGACHSCPAPVQAKLTISQPGDRYEQEADRVADRVMSMPEPAGRLQRECGDCEDEAQRQPVEEEEDKEEVARKLIQRQAEPGGPEEEEEPPTAAAKAQPGHKPVVSPGMAADIQSLRSSGGQPLPDSTRAFFEPRFGHDFSQVRVHADAKAADTAQAVRAKAFTVGRDIVFGGGQYTPDTQGGRRLLAHELAHVAQQRRQLSPTTYGQTPNHILRLGANPGCSAAHQNLTHQAIYNARGWLQNTVREMKKTPPTKKVIASLRRNFGNTYGVSANIPLILGRLRRIFRELAVMQFGCSGVADPICAGGTGGYAVTGSHQATVCTNNVFPAGPDWRVAALVVLHEAFHATYSNFTVDNYSGSYGITPTTANYPGPGTDPLLNADSYRTLVMDLS